MTTERAPVLLELVKRDSEKRKRELGIDSRRSGPEIGSTGLEVFGGIITGDIVDHNRDWMDQKRFETVDLMRRGDSTVAATLYSMQLPILSSEAHVDARKGPNGEKPDSTAIEAAEFIHDALFSGDLMSQGWQQFLREAMNYLAYGHYVFEKVFHEIEGGRWSGAVTWKKFAPRHPATIERWLFDKNGGKRGVVQLVNSEATDSSGVEVEIPIEKLLIMTHQEEAGNPLGVSVLRPAYKHWRYKDGFYAVQAIAIERQGAGVPYAEYPPGTDDDDQDKAEEMLQNVQAHEQSYFLYQEDWTVGFVDMGAGSVLDPQNAIEHHDVMIPKAVLASFMNLPQDSRGSFALSSDQSGFFNHSLQVVANYIADILNKHAIPQLIDFNYPGLEAYPKVRFDRIGHISMDRTLEAIKDAVKEGVLTPDIELENRVRDLLNLPAISEETFEEEKEEEAASQPPPVGGDEEPPEDDE